MKCPNCGNKYVCPCIHCAETFSKGKIPWIRYGDDTESCPKCGLRKHMDWWLDVEYEQFKKPSRPPQPPKQGITGQDVPKGAE